VYFPSRLEGDDLAAPNGEVTEPAWKEKPSWYMVATDDHMIPVPAQRMTAARAGATTVDQAGSHAVYVSQPEAVAKLIEEAAKGVSKWRSNPTSNALGPPIPFGERGAWEPGASSSPSVFRHRIFTPVCTNPRVDREHTT
jgi:hypothetical protein